MSTKHRAVRRWLNSYKILKKAVRLKEKHLNDFIIDMYGPLKMSISRLSRKSPSNSQALNLLLRMNNIYMEIIEDLSNDIEKTKNAMQRIFDVINRLDNYERSICFSRYIMGYSWSETALHLGYEERQCQRREEKAIKKISEMEDFDINEFNDLEV